MIKSQKRLEGSIIEEEEKKIAEVDDEEVEKANPCIS
jgi:hypothetical protein